MHLCYNVRGRVGDDVVRIAQTHIATNCMTCLGTLLDSQLCNSDLAGKDNPRSDHHQSTRSNQGIIAFLRHSRYNVLVPQIK
jgi:hypothetical protein